MSATYQNEASKFAMKRLSQLIREPSGRAPFRRKTAIVRQRHPRAFSVQRVHNPGEILAAGKQAMIEPHPCRMPADLCE